MIWFALAIFAATMIMMSQMTMPDAVRAQDKDFQLPTVSNSKAIPVIFGSVMLADPNVLNYGNIRSTKITKSYRAGFKKKHQTVGYQYYMDVDFSLCWGEVDSILSIDAGDFRIHGAVNSTGGFNISKRSIFGDEGGGSSGIEGSAHLYSGHGNYVRPSIMNKIYGNAPRPNNNGVARVAFSGYIGNLTQLRSWRFAVKRIPKVLNNAKAEIDGDANPAYIMYEALTNKYWGLGITSVNEASFIAAGDTLFTEKLGLSIKWSSDMAVDEFLDEICRHINAVWYTDLTTGQVMMKLIRDDYNPDQIPHLNDDNITMFRSFKRADSSEIATEVKVKYMSRKDNYKEMIATAINGSGERYLSRIISQVREFHGFSNAENALKVANRELSILSMSPAELEVQCMLNQRLIPGEAIKMSYSRHGIVSLICRIKSVNWGTLEDNTVTIKMVEDVFAYRDAQFGSVPDSGWTPESHVPDPITHVVGVPCGAYFAEYPALLFLPTPVQGAESFSVYESLTGSSTDESDYDNIGDGFPMGNGGLTQAILDKNDVEISVATNYIASTVTLDEMRQGRNLVALFDDNHHEFISFETWDSTGSNPVMKNVRRGVLDTPPRDWPAGTNVAFIENAQAPVFADGGSLSRNYRFISRGTFGFSEWEDSTNFPFTLSDSYLFPLYTPVFWGTERFPDSIPKADIDIKWKLRSSTDTVVLPEDPSEVVPTSQVYFYELSGDVDGVIHTKDNTRDDTLTVTAADIGTNTTLTFKVKTKNNGRESVEYNHTVNIS